MLFDLTGRGLKEEKMVRGAGAIIQGNTVALRPAQKPYKKPYDSFQFWRISVQCRQSRS